MESLQRVTRFETRHFDSRRRWALGLYALLTPLAFPHALPGGGSVDFGIVLAWGVPAALVLGIAGLAPRAAARLAFLASMVGHFLLFHWFMVVTVVYGGMPAWLGGLAPIVPAFYVSIFTALFAAGWALLSGGGRPTSAWFSSPFVLALSGAALWVAVDWARAHFLGGFPWATLGYALHLDLPLLAWTRWGGVYVLSFLAALLGIALALWIRGRSTAARNDLVGCLVGIVLAHGVGVMLKGGVAEGAPRLRVAAIQGNVEQGQKWDASRRQEIFDTYLRLSEEAAVQGAQWIVWPETAVPGYLEYDAALRSKLAELAGRYDATFIVGGMGLDLDEESGRPSAFYDSAFVMDPTGRLVDRYDKTHLVPFGEFVPLRGLLGQVFESLATGLATSDVTPGPAPRTLVIEAGSRDASSFFGSPQAHSGSPQAHAGSPHAPGASPVLESLQTLPLTHRVGIPICYELLFPHLVRQFGAQQAGLLLAITNDAWYGRTGAPHQFLAMTAMRAAESGLFTVRAANTGISAVIEPNGRVREASPLFEEAVIVGDIRVQKGTEATFYSRFGDIFAALCIGWTGLWGARMLLDRGKAPAGAREEG